MLFVVQKHLADRAGLHYDFRLEDGGSLQSWVLRYIPVEKGKKRLAIKVDDHPRDWADFEGEIEEGYGKGSVEIFDQGEYEVLESSLGWYKLYLAGERLVGDYGLKRWEKNKWFMWRY